MLLPNLSFQAAIPTLPLTVQLTSPALPPKLTERLASACNDAAKKAAPSKHLVKAIEPLAVQISKNLLLYAMPEVKKLKKAYAACASKVIANEESGSLKLLIKPKESMYMLTATICVPRDYPKSPPQVSFKKCTFPGSISRMYQAQANELARKLSLGFSLEEAMHSSNAPTQVQERGKIKRPQIAITSEYVRNLKSDVSFLKKASDLRKVNGAFNKQLHKFDHDTKTRRAARRELKKLSKREASIENARADKEIAEALRSLNVDGERCPQRSIAAVGEFLLSFASNLPRRKCPISGAKLFPSDPDVLKKKGSSKRAPTRALCGCWFTFAALDSFLTTPPLQSRAPSAAPRGYCTPTGPTTSRSSSSSGPESRQRSES